MMMLDSEGGTSSGGEERKGMARKGKSRRDEIPKAARCSKKNWERRLKLLDESQRIKLFAELLVRASTDDEVEQFIESIYRKTKPKKLRASSSLVNLIKHGSGSGSNSGSASVGSMSPIGSGKTLTTVGVQQQKEQQQQQGMSATPLQTSTSDDALNSSGSSASITISPPPPSTPASTSVSSSQTYASSPTPSSVLSTSSSALASSTAPASTTSSLSSAAAAVFPPTKDDTIGSSAIPMTSRTERDKTSGRRGFRFGTVDFSGTTSTSASSLTLASYSRMRTSEGGRGNGSGSGSGNEGGGGGLGGSGSGGKGGSGGGGGGGASEGEEAVMDSMKETKRQWRKSWAAQRERDKGTNDLVSQSADATALVVPQLVKKVGFVPPSLQRSSSTDMKKKRSKLSTDSGDLEEAKKDKDRDKEKEKEKEKEREKERPEKTRSWVVRMLRGTDAKFAEQMVNVLKRQEEEWWREEFKTLGPGEVLLSVHHCKHNNKRGLLFISSKNVCFCEDIDNRFTTHPVDISCKKIIHHKQMLFIRRVASSITITTIMLVKETFTSFENGQLALASDALNDNFKASLQAAQSFFPALSNNNLALLHELFKLPDAKNRALELSVSGETPLALAVRSNNVPIVRAFLQFFKANSIDVNQADTYGYTALHVACLYSVNDDVIRALLKCEGINVDIATTEGNTPLHYFCKSFLSPTCQEIAAELLKFGADPNKRNQSGETPLHKAIVNDSVRVLLIEFLLANGADVNLLNKKGESALHYAVRLGRKDVVALLVCAGANTEEAGNVFKKTPRQLADEYGQVEIATYLRKVNDLLLWLKEITLENLLLFFVTSEVFLEDLGRMKKDEFFATIDRAEQEHGALEQRDKLVEAWSALSEKHKSIIPLDRIVEQSEIIGEADKEYIRSNLRTFLEEQQEGDRDALFEISGSLGSKPNWQIAQTELEFTKLLGSGVSGKVYRGLYQRKEVAIKVLTVLHGGQRDRNEMLTEWLEEIKLLSLLTKSSYVVKLFGVCLEPTVCIVMEYCARGSLNQHLSNPKTNLSWAQAIDFAKQSITGIHHLHSADPQVLHRDVKTPNLLVTGDWRVVCADFGLARLNTTDNQKSLGQACGTIAYMAPELFYGENYTTHCDIYSMGIVLWEIIYKCITGEYTKPFAEFGFFSDMQIAVQAAELQVRPTIPKECPEAMSALIQRCWAHKASTRPTAKEILDRIAELEDDYRIAPNRWESTRRQPGTPKEI